MSIADRTGTTGGAHVITGLTAAATRAREAQERALIGCTAPGGARVVTEAAELEERLEAAVVAALDRGHPAESVAAALAPVWGPRARFGAMGRLAAACAPVAEVEQVLLAEGRDMGGEVPADRSAHLRAALARTRADLDAALRGALVRGVSPGEILGIARAGGLELEDGDLLLAFEGRRGEGQGG